MRLTGYEHMLEPGMERSQRSLSLHSEAAVQEIMMYVKKRMLRVDSGTFASESAIHFAPCRPWSDCRAMSLKSRSL